jgi:precorrin-2 dehydrogenase/sirohydrochlorin ferrochelatase
MPDLCDFYTPATLEKGSIRVGICTDGKSPLMSKMIKHKLNTQLTEEDALHVELQHHCREIAKKEIHDTDNRRETLYKIYHDQTINKLLKENQLESAKKQAENYLRQNKGKDSHELPQA